MSAAKMVSGAVCFALAGLLAATAVAEAGKFESPMQRYKNMTPKEREEMRLRILKKSGGKILAPGKGLFLYYDYRTPQKLPEATTNAVDFVCKRFKRHLQSDVRVVSAPKGARFKVETAADDRVVANANAIVYVVSDPSLPMSLIAPEASWAMVNEAPLKADNPDADKLSLRLVKMLMRATSLVLGGAESELSISALRPVSSLAELDASAGSGIDPRTTMAIYRHLPTIGMVQDRYVTYKSACQEGWAPAPTNEYQKAIWDQFKKK